MLTREYADFEAREYERRLARLRDRMSRNRLDAVLITTDTNHRYFSGHWTHRWGHKFTSLFALLPLERDPVLIVPPLETGMCEEDAWIEDLRTYQPPIRVRAGVSLLTDVIRELGLAGARVGAELGGVLWSRMPYDDFGRLKANLPCVDFTDASRLLWKTRFAKSGAEIDYIRKAVGITNRAYGALFATARPGMTERDLYSLLCVEHLKRGMDAPGSITLAAFVPGDARSSNRSLRRHTDRVLTEGELIAHDAGGVYRGYWSDYTRMFALGRARQKHKDAYRTVHECLQAAIGAIRPGMPISDLVRVSNETLTRAGYAEQARRVTGIGHAIGLDIIEPPFIELEDDTLLEEGMVLTVEPSLYTDGAYFMLEEDVVVTESGFEILSEPAPGDLPIL